MKIGIITIYDGNNMGSFLQAIALQYAIEDLGHEVVFVRRMTEEENINLYLNRRFSKPRPFPFNYLAEVKRAIFNRSEDNNRREEIKKIYNVLSMERKSLPLTDPDKLSDVDLLICGSDEIWNFRNTSISVPFYSCQGYGNDISKVAFAVSIGTSMINDFKHHPDIIKTISGFKGVFPRDLHSKEVLEEALNKNLDTVCDPTLLVNKNRLQIKECPEYLTNKPYIMLYAYDLSKDEKEYLKRFSKESGIQIVSVLHYSDIADMIITESPYAFANIISNAEYCYTSTFHGTIFCTLFANRFVYRSRRLKVKQVAEYMNVGSREWISGSYQEFKSLMESYVDRKGIEDTLTDIRMINTNLLRGIIENADI